MYFTHSPTREVFAYTYDPSTGAMSDKRVFYKHEGSGEPDGHRVDVEGNVWHAVHGESMVLRINPAGEVTGRIRLPTRGVTCVQFVGEELFITTAEDEIGSSESESVKLGGAVFRVHVGVRGVDLFKFKM
jgi:sugar lactone lactonase YvrE